MRKTKIREARSIKNGIIFCSSSIPLIMVKSTINEKGEIRTRVIDQITEREEELKEKRNEKNKRSNMLIKAYLTDLIILTIMIFLKVDTRLFTGMVTFSIVGTHYLCPVLYNIYNIKYKFKSLGRFHSAEHMVINAYNKLDRIPTWEELKKSSRFSNHCGSNKANCIIIILAFISFAGPFLINMGVIKYLIIMMLIPIIIAVLSSVGAINILQVFVTNKPTDVELQVALEGLKRYEDLENQTQDISRIEDFMDTMLTIFEDHGTVVLMETENLN